MANASVSTTVTSETSAETLAMLKPAFVLIWLLTIYLTLGILESVTSLAQKITSAMRETRDTVPPAE